METDRLSQFAENLHQEVIAKNVSDNGDGDNSLLLREELFTETVLSLLNEHNEVDEWELCSYEAKSVGAQPAAKLNAWAMSGDGATLDLFVTLYAGSGKVHEVGKPDVRRQFELALGFLKRALAGFHTRIEEASDAFVTSQAIHAARETLTTVRLILICDMVARSLDIEPETVPGLDIKYVAWDLEKLSRLRVGAREAIEINFADDYGGGVPCIETADATGEYRTFLLFLRAPLLARIYGEYGQRLLERNVRAFLQTKGKVNKGIQTTLRTEPNRFLAYNNGLCCTAGDIELGHNGGTEILQLLDFQIVNGGQTTASIFHAIKKEKMVLDDVCVQVKLTVLSNPELVAEVVPEISRFANSQNKVNGADFAANGKFHRDLEELSRTVWAPAATGMERGSHWYYERARGSYFDDKERQGTPARIQAWLRQNPPRQKFTKTDLAKYEHAWLGLPHLVCRGAEKNFAAYAARLEDDSEPVVDVRFFERAIGRAILWRSTEAIFNALGLQGHRANSVAYCVAWIAERTGRRIDLDGIWRDQKIPADIAGVIRVVCAESHKFLTSRPGNIGEASKKPETWAQFREMNIEVGNELCTLARSPEAISYPPKKSTPAAAAAKEAVTAVNANSWFALSKWAKERGFLEGWERSLSFSLGRIVSKGGTPSDKQAVQGARIMARARELGFVDRE